MPGRIVIALVSLVIVAGVLMMLPVQGADPEDAMEVFVTNLPEIQDIQGTVSVEGIVQHAALASLSEVEVPPVGREEVRRLVHGGTLTTDGFSALVLSLTGQAKGDIHRSGEVGAILIPDEDPIVRAFDERGQFQFPLEISAEAAVDMPLFSSDQPRYIIGFPRYRVLFFNTTDKTVTVDLYAYLTN